MRVLAAVLLAGAVAALVGARSRVDLGAVVGRYLRPAAPSERAGRRRIDPQPVLWSAVGALAGILLGQGDLFVAGPSRHVPLIGVLGGGAGYLAWSMRRSMRRDRAARHLRYELPIICDALALQVVAGESVASAIGNVTDATTGVVASELRIALEAGDRIGLEASLLQAASDTAHPDGRRLYDLLAHAHATGGRLADALVDLGADYRAGLERDLTTESGRAMVTTYGPVLALMVPTALLFLLYPTLLGLRSLTGAP